MAIKYTIKKKDEETDERTVGAEEFIHRVISMKEREIEKIKEIPNTEIKK